ncbi:hypothetical protein FJ964_30750 [Mesorhizobium sp. B2-3-2]|nr:hypothetical protein FJ964_30750 [Mesorhizobium sp. B2-3-2]
MSSPGAPLWPASHLPHKGGDRQRQCRRLSCNVGVWRRALRQPIFPLVGEMPGRAEGSASHYNSLALELAG